MTKFFIIKLNIDKLKAIYFIRDFSSSCHFDAISFGRRGKKLVCCYYEKAIKIYNAKPNINAWGNLFGTFMSFSNEIKELKLFCFKFASLEQV